MRRVGTVRPTSSPASESRYRLNCRGMNAQYSSSFLRRIDRETLRQGREFLRDKFFMVLPEEPTVDAVIDGFLWTHRRHERAASARSPARRRCRNGRHPEGAAPRPHRSRPRRRGCRDLDQHLDSDRRTLRRDRCNSLGLGRLQGWSRDRNGLRRTRLVSLGSLAAAALFAPALFLIRLATTGGLDGALIAYGLVGPALVWLAHADNIARLRNGTERTFDAGMLQRD